MASIHDINDTYSNAREIAAFIKDHSLENLKILCQWNIEESKHTSLEGNDDYINTYLIDSAVTINAYFPNNICFNLNNGADEFAYVLHKVPDYTECRDMVKEWAEEGIPDVIIGYPKLAYVYGDSISYQDYCCASIIKSGFIWKDKETIAITPIYLRNDLLERYDFDDMKRS